MVLDKNIIYQVALLLTLIGVWTCFVIWYKVRKVNQTSFLSINMISIVGITILILQMMDTVTIGLPIDLIFKMFVQYMSIIFSIMLLLYIFIRLNRMRVKKYFTEQLPDLKTVFYSIEDLAVIIDYDGVVVEVNHPNTYETLFCACTHIDEIINKIIKDSKDQDIICIKESLTRDGKQKPVKVTVKSSEKVFLFTFTSIFNKGIFIGYAMVVYDITNQKQVEKALEDQIAYMEIANKKLEDSVAIINSLESEKVRLELVDKVQKDLITKIEKMVTQVHNIQKTHYDTMQEYHKAIHDVADFLREIYKDVRGSIKELFSDQKGVL